MFDPDGGLPEAGRHPSGVLRQPTCNPHVPAETRCRPGARARQRFDPGSQAETHRGEASPCGHQSLARSGIDPGLLEAARRDHADAGNTDVCNGYRSSSKWMESFSWLGYYSTYAQAKEVWFWEVRWGGCARGDEHALADGHGV
jgi:hypothetical protein